MLDGSAPERRQDATPGDLVIAYFDELEAARTWRVERGGWIFVSDSGPVIWFSLRFTPTPILLHPALRGMTGRLV